MTVPSTSIASRLATGSRASLSHGECRPPGPTHEREAYQTSRLMGNWMSGAIGSDRREDLGPRLRHRDRVLEVGSQGPVAGDDCPVVRHDPRLPRAEGEHRLDREAQARLQLA